MVQGGSFPLAVMPRAGSNFFFSRLPRFGVWGLGDGIQGLGCGVSGSRFGIRFWGFGSRVQSLGVARPGLSVVHRQLALRIRDVGLQGYLAHKKQRPPRTLRWE